MSRKRSDDRRRRSRSRSYSSRSASPDDENGVRLHVADLGMGVSKRELQHVFDKYGPLREIWVAKSPPCFAFVVFKEKDDAEDAVKATDGMTLCGSRIRGVCVGYGREVIGLIGRKSIAVGPLGDLWLIGMELRYWRPANGGIKTGGFMVVLIGPHLLGVAGAADHLGVEDTGPVVVGVSQKVSAFEFEFEKIKVILITNYVFFIFFILRLRFKLIIQHIKFFKFGRLLPISITTTMQSEFYISEKDIVSIGVEIANEKHLRKLNQNEPLSEIVHSLCKEFHLSKDSRMYALQFTEYDGGGENKYVTEENRGEIKNASILRLVLSPAECVKQIVTRLTPDASETEARQWALIKLSTLSADPVFAKAFLESNGFKTIKEIILDEKEIPAHTTYCLRSMIWLMRHNLIPPLEEQITIRLVVLINSEQHLPMELIECCLEILEKSIRHKGNSTVGVGIPDLIQHLWNRESPVVQEKALALINALAQQDADSKKILALMVSKQIRDTIQNNILCYDISPGMAHELYVYQTLILGLLNKDLKTKIDLSGEDAKSIAEINNILATAEQQMRSMKGSLASLAEEGQQVGFLDKESSVRNFSKKPFFKEEFVCSTPQPLKSLKKASYIRSRSTPPPESHNSKESLRYSLTIDFSEESSSPSVLISKLTLNCMLHFARRYRRTFVRVVQEEETLSRPFPSTCENIVKLLCELLGIGKPPTREGKLYQPMVFTASVENPFVEELFCRAALLMGRTRREMRARTLGDQEKVMRVVRRQLREALELKPVSLDHLDDHLRRFPYSIIAEIWQKERDEKEKRNLEHLPPILQLKEERTEHILDLIEQQRINILLKGTKFPRYTARGQRVKKKSWFAQLSTNQRAIHYGDCDDDDRLILDCTSKISVSNIRMLVTGKKCPHVRELRGRKNEQEMADLSFSILLDEEPHNLDFVAPDQKTFDYWTDGINCLLGQPMTSGAKESEFQTLLELDIRLQLLDTEGINIPSKPPPIPSDPPNYNFHYK
ncbi:hypothetical protein C0J52_07938 [Blattella germanica]|nr:hypothetical protein C0J52_07938 [Blattella germanica]